MITGFVVDFGYSGSKKKSHAVGRELLEDFVGFRVQLQSHPQFCSNVADLKLRQRTSMINSA